MLAIRRYSELISMWAMIALFALLPVFFVPLPWVTLPESKVLLIIALLFVAIASWSVTAFVDGGVRIPRTWILISAALLPIAYGVSTLMTGATSLSIWGSGVEQDTLAAVCIWYMALVGTAVMFSDTLIKSIYAIRALFVGALVLEVLEFIHLLFPSLTSFGGVLTSQTANLLGGWYEFGIFSGLLLFTSLACMPTPVASRRWKYLTWAVAMFSFLSLVVVNVREVWIALAAMSLACIVLDVVAGKHWYQLRYIRTWQSYRIWIASTFVALFFVFFGAFVNTHLPSVIKVSMTEVRPSWQGTLQIGSRTLSQPSRLVFGAGPNTFMREWALHKPIEINQTAFWNTDFISGIGSIPTSLITIGVFGGLAWALFIISILWVGLRVSHSSPRQGAAMVLEPLLLGALFLVVFHVFYVPGPTLSILTFLLLGVAIGYAASMGRIRHFFVTIRGRTPSAWAYLGGLIIFLFVVVISCASIVRVVAAEILINQSITTYNATKDLARSSRLVAEALRIYPEDTRGQRAAVELGFLQIQELANAAPSDQTTARLKTAIENTIHYGLSAVSINGDDYQNWLELAMLYQQLAGANVQGAYENAQDAYARIIVESPTNPLPYLQRARLELLQKNTDAALRDLAQALHLKPDFAAAFYLASQIYASQNDFKNALLAAADAARYAPSDPQAWYNLGAVAYTAGDYADASVALEHALVLEPQFANSLYVLGLTYYQLGRIDDAKKTFQQLDTVTPDQKIVQDILSNLNAGKAPFPAAAKDTTITSPSHIPTPQKK